MRLLALLLLAACAAPPPSDPDAGTCPPGWVAAPLGTCQRATPADPSCTDAANRGLRCCTPNAVLDPFCSDDAAFCPEGTRTCNATGQLLEGTSCDDFPVPCASGTVCASPDGACGRQQHRICRKISEFCGDTHQVCGCDGLVHPDPCVAAMGGVEPDSANHCSPPTGTVACGASFCDVSSDLCKRAETSAGVFLKQACAAFPPGCQDCSCLGATPGCRCEALGAGFALTCGVDK